MELLNASTLLSHTCSISSSWLTGRPWFANKYSRIPVSFLVKESSLFSALAIRERVSNVNAPHVRRTSCWITDAASSYGYALRVLRDEMVLRDSRWLLGQDLPPYLILRFLQIK